MEKNNIKIKCNYLHKSRSSTKSKKQIKSTIFIQSHEEFFWTSFQPKDGKNFNPILKLLGIETSLH